LVDVARATLALLARETDPVTWPAIDGVRWFDLGRGMTIALYPMHPARRFALDSHVGFLLFKNSLPVAYGGGWPFLGNCRIGVNVFPAYRGGESALLFCQVLRTYAQRYGVARFIVEPYQFGAGNREGLQSGALWFYWRLGFRPVDPKAAVLGAAEFARMAADRSYRPPLTTMRKLTRDDLALVVDADRAGAVEPEPARVAGDRGDGPRVAVQRHGAHRAARQRLEREHARPRVGLERLAAGQILAKPVEERLAHPVGRGPKRCGDRKAHDAAAASSADDADGVGRAGGHGKRGPGGGRRAGIRTAGAA